MKDLFSLEGKTALVTGGGHGIGEMIARGLAERGARVFVCSRNPGDGDDAITPISADLSRGDEILRLAREMSDRADRLDILVNNSGVTWGAPIDAFPESGWDKVIDLNLKSPFFLTQALLPLIEKAASANDPGRIVNIGSVDGLHVGLFEAYSYAASKAGIHHLTRIMAKFLAPRHITVNAIAPGPFESKMMKPILDKMGDDMAGSVPLRRLGRPDDMAGAAVYLTSRAGAYVTGATLVVDGGLATTA